MKFYFSYFSFHLLTTSFYLKVFAIPIILYPIFTWKTNSSKDIRILDKKIETHFIEKFKI